MSVFWQVLATEGPRAVRDRLLDRLAGARRRHGFRRLGAGDALPGVEVLNVLPTPPRPDWGGVQRQLVLRLDAEAALRDWALLYPEGDRYRLEVAADGRRIWRPIDAPGPGEAIRRAASALGARIVHVEQIVGLPFAELAALASGGLALVLSIHDFGLFCRRPHLIEEPQRRFCDFSRDAARCARCLAHDDAAVAPDAQERWREASQQLLDAARAVIYPSDSLHRAHAALFRLDPERQQVIAPPVVALPTEVPELRRGPLRHLAYVGSVQPHKGADVLIALIASMQQAHRTDLRWSIYGGGDPELLRRLRALPGVRVRGYYRAGSLPALLRRDQVDLALLLSIWPETYALTLDECRLAGVPVLAFDHGAPADRIRDWQAGTLVAPAAGVAGVREAIEILARDGGPSASTARPRLADAPAAAEACALLYRRLGIGLTRDQST